MAILLDCCLSGAFIENESEFQEGICDIGKDGRVILTSAYKDSLSLLLSGWGSPCIRFFSYAIKNEGTKNLTAEDIFSFVKKAKYSLANLAYASFNYYCFKELFSFAI